MEQPLNDSENKNMRNATNTQTANNKSAEDGAVWKGQDTGKQEKSDSKKLGSDQEEEVPFVQPGENEYNTGREEDLNDFEHRQGEVEHMQPPKRGPVRSGNEAII